jgi:hypothetical protein
MKTYYPNDPEWNPLDKISKSSPKRDIVTYAWDFEYEDYHPFDVFESNSKTLTEMNEIQTFGCTIHLTLTCGLDLTDKQIAAVCSKFIPFGHMYLRLNHECNGFWFRYNKKHSYNEIANFFVKFKEIASAICPKVKMVFSVSADSYHELGHVVIEKLHLKHGELLNALNAADYWSIDKYCSLNWGWPYSEPKTGGTSFWDGSPEKWWTLIHETYLAMIHESKNCFKPLYIHEFNADADVNGDEGQANMIREVYSKIKIQQTPWLEGISMYQFRDDGGLGLERRSGNSVIQLPSFFAYFETVDHLDKKVYTEVESADHFTFCWNNECEIRGLSIKNVNSTEFSNIFSFPVFICLHDTNDTFRLKAGESINIKKDLEFSLFVPPYRQGDGSYSYSYFMTTKELKAMLAYELA